MGLAPLYATHVKEGARNADVLCRDAGHCACSRASHGSPDEAIDVNSFASLCHSFQRETGREAGAGAGGGHKDISTLCFDRFGACYCM